MANRTTFWSAIVFLVGSTLATASWLSARPIDMIRLMLDRREAPGVILATQKTGITVNNSPILNVRFTFKTGEGVEHLGNCRAPSSAIGGPANGAFPRPCIVEYWAGDPAVSRIQGGRFGSLDGWLLGLLSLVPVVSLLIVPRGLSWARQRIRLLEAGEVAVATLLSYQIAGKSEVLEEVPITTLLERAKGRSPVTGPGHTPPLARIAPGCITIWMMWTGLIVGLGAIALGTALVVMLLPGAPPMKINNQVVSRLTGVLFLVGLLTAWLLIGALFLRHGNSGRQSAFRELAIRGLRAPFGSRVVDPSPATTQSPEQSELSTLLGDPPLPVTLEFLPRGAAGPAKLTLPIRLGRVPLGPPPGPYMTPLLYDPDRQDVAWVLSDLPHGLVFNEIGEWETTEGWRGLARLVLIVAALLGGPVLGWLIHRLG